MFSGCWTVTDADRETDIEDEIAVELIAAAVGGAIETLAGAARLGNPTFLRIVGAAGAGLEAAC